MMVFTSPAWVPSLSGRAFDSISIPQFMLEDRYGRFPLKESKNPFTCGISGKTYSAVEMADRVECLAKALSKDLGWYPNDGTEWDKVVGIFSFNTIDYMTLVYAIHRLSGIATPINAAYSSSELELQLKSSGAKVLFTCIPLLEKSFKVAKKINIPDDRIYILDMPEEFSKLSGNRKVPFITVGGLIAEGMRRPPLEPLKWNQGQGARQTAYLCYSSGTSGHPKGVMISHSNVIANVIQIATFENACTESRQKHKTETCLGLLPLSHIYGLIAVAKASTWRGDGVIILPKFELEMLLSSIQKYQIESLYLVPPVIINIMKNARICDKYDLSSVKTVFTGAASFGIESAEELHRRFPLWLIRQGYGLTETATVVSHTPTNDILFGSSGCLIPGVSVKLLSADGEEICEYDQPGELIVQSPSVVLGYHKNDQANRETFIDDTDGRGKWVRTGDEAVIRKTAGGNDHIFITDRIKELIKVKGMQVAPAELEAHLLSHPFVVDCAVISIPDDIAGEVPKAFIVKSPSIIQAPSYDLMVKGELCKFVEQHKANYKWLKGGIEFIDAIPKSPSGKILRRLLRDKENRMNGVKL